LVRIIRLIVGRIKTHNHRHPELKGCEKVIQEAVEKPGIVLKGDTGKQG